MKLWHLFLVGAGAVVAAKLVRGVLRGWLNLPV